MAASPTRLTDTRGALQDRIVIIDITLVVYTFTRTLPPDDATGLQQDTDGRVVNAYLQTYVSDAREYMEKKGISIKAFVLDFGHFYPLQFDVVPSSNSRRVSLMPSKSKNVEECLRIYKTLAPLHIFTVESITPEFASMNPRRGVWYRGILEEEPGFIQGAHQARNAARQYDASDAVNSGTALADLCAEFACCTSSGLPCTAKEQWRLLRFLAEL